MTSGTALSTLNKYTEELPSLISKNKDLISELKQESLIPLRFPFLNFFNAHEKKLGYKKRKMGWLTAINHIIQQVLNAKVHKDIENSPLKNQQPAERLTACNRASQLLLVANLAKQLIHKIAHGNPVWITNSDHYTTEQDRGKTGERITASLRIISCIHSYSAMYFKSLLPDIIEDLIKKKESLKPKEIIKALEDEIEGFREILTEQHTSNSINQIILDAVSNPQESSIRDGVELTCFKIK